MTEFNNYAEQVNSAVNGMVAYNNYTEVSRDFTEYLPKNILNSQDEVVEWFVVSIYGESKTTEQLGIFYDEFLNLYILPVMTWGVSWEQAAPVNMLENEENE
ncbi:hypothetical protein AB0X79_08160 [Pediococcus pentosaceus]|uniref:hypothetical protein n=1 Tax=Pediococcus pentosaceus TaxID=1255 RepID=UPI003F24A097